ncbi:hypothetical protein SAMN05421823_108178 [Catalinimonas alkaloidigena]|uniref:Ligand-binding SRPBCC domain-containing protein n=2 Tax=Catalinimonas alkaloidigena TaxID=1075417 RepID=A0A1G9N4H4_9BACT|nr:hypothetical protein SAMN05421823_108178 [Catalinimonas alkaloidigena]
MENRKEQAVAGKTSGLLALHDCVTWRAKHLGIWQHLTSCITQYESPHYFRDSMQQGAFHRFDHDHFFEAHKGGTRMRDVFDYTTPFGMVGRFADGLFLEQYMRRLLMQRNQVLKHLAEAPEGVRW